MREQELLKSIDRAIAQARFGVYRLLDVNEALGQRIDAKLREASKIIQAQSRLIDRTQNQRPLSKNPSPPSSVG